MSLSLVQRMQVWSTNNIEGVHRFLARVYRLIAEQEVGDAEPSQDQRRLLHATIKKVGLLSCCCKGGRGWSTKGGRRGLMHLEAGILVL